MSVQHDPMRVGIIGLGPVGSTLAVHLAEAGANIVLCDVDLEKTDHIAVEGIYLQNAIEKHHAFNQFVNRIGDLADYGLDLVIICVKTPILSLIIGELAKIDDGRFRVMCAQNGIDNEKIASAVFGVERTLRMVINYAGAMLAPYRVNVSFFNPPNYVSAIHSDSDLLASQFAELLSGVTLETNISENIQDHVWEKAILNSSLSPVCAITDRTMQEVMEFPPTLEIVESIIDESIEIAAAEGLHLSPDFKERALVYLNKGGPHRPTMLVDLDNGLATEIESLNGKIAEYGKRHHIDVPCNAALANLIRMMEHRPEAIHA